MLIAIFTLIGTVLGVLGVVAAQILGARTEELRARRKELRDACADFASAVARVREIGFQLIRSVPGSDVAPLEQAHLEARAQYERLRLIASTRSVQEAGRRALRHCFGIVLQATGKPLREDEMERGPARLVNDSLLDLYVAVRRELRVPHPDAIYREPDAWSVPYVAPEANISESD